MFIFKCHNFKFMLSPVHLLSQQETSMLCTKLMLHINEFKLMFQKNTTNSSLTASI